jgi:hypothetical protein
MLGSVAIAVTVMLLVRRRAPEGSYFSDGDRASGVFGVLATGFAIFAGFVIFLAFTTYDQSRSGGEAEALAVAQQFETAQFFPSGSRELLAGQLTCYGRYVINEEWPQMESGDSPRNINPWGVAMFRSLQEVTPSTPTQQSAYDKWLDQTSTREEARRDRIHGAAGIIPAPIWFVLFLTAAIVFTYMLFFADRAERALSQAMLMGSATAVVVATMLAINALDNPYREGPGSIQPVAMERTLALVDEARDVLGLTTPPPCDEDGRAS